MGKVTGFMEFERLKEASEAPQSRTKHYKEFVCIWATKKPRFRARAAWIAASRSATTAARSTTSFLTGMIWCIRATTSKRSTPCTRPTISPSSPAASARRHANPHAHWASTAMPSASSRLSISSSTRVGKTVGSCRNRHKSRPARKWPWSAPVLPAWRQHSNWRVPAMM